MILWIWGHCELYHSADYCILSHFRIGWIPHNRVDSGKVLTRKQALENFLNSLTSSASGGLVFNIYEVDYQSIAMHCEYSLDPMTYYLLHSFGFLVIEWFKFTI